MPRLSRSLPLLAAAGLVVALAAVPALAQAEAAATAPTMPRPKFADSPPVLLNMILAVLLTFAVAAPNFIPSKRGHQD